MKKRYWFIAAIFSIALLGWAFLDRQSKTVHWVHMELGAGNYGKEGHTKTSLKKTVLRELLLVTDKPNFIDKLPIKDDKPYMPAHQYAVLFDTLDKLIEKYGDYGAVHINDLIPEYSQYAAEQLTIYSKEKGYHIKVSSIPGDYTKIDPAKTLKKFDRNRYDSVHLKNPEISFYNYGLDGDSVISSSESRQHAREKLQTLANLSKTGLYFFPVDYENYFIPPEEKEEFINKGIFYLPTSEWQAVAYCFPEGGELPVDYGRVYFIKANQS